MEVVLERADEMPLVGLFMHAALEARRDALARAAPAAIWRSRPGA